MMKRLLCVLPLLLVAAVADAKLLVQKLDAAAITRGLPLEGHEATTSGDGKPKHVWKIKGVNSGRLEVIGNQRNADSVGWTCSVFDAKGNRVSPAAPDNACHQLFVQVLGKVVDKPAEIAKQLTARATGQQTASITDGALSFETDGEYFFIRHHAN